MAKKNMQAPNARFWIWWRGGWVKLTLQCGEEVTLLERGPTDEGWFSYAEVYSHDVLGVSRVIESDGSDCDGRLSNTSEHYCPLSELKDRDMMEVNPCPENEGIFAPHWDRVTESQRDYAAEAAGY